MSVKLVDLVPEDINPFRLLNLNNTKIMGEYHLLRYKWRARRAGYAGCNE